MEEAKYTARQIVKHRLGEYRAIKAEQRQIQRQIDDLDGAPGGVNLDGLPRGSGTGDPTGAIVVKRDSLREAYKEKLAELLEAQRRIEAMIEGLEPVERSLLRHRYIEGLSWEGVCVEMHYSWRQTHNIHARALDKLAEMEGETHGKTD